MWIKYIISTSSTFLNFKCVCKLSRNKNYMHKRNKIVKTLSDVHQYLREQKCFVFFKKAHIVKKIKAIQKCGQIKIICANYKYIEIKTNKFNDIYTLFLN